MSEPTVAVALLSMGNRPQELAHALETLKAQRGVKLDVVLVGNGWEPEGVPEWVRTHYSPENTGCPAGRNLAASLSHGEYIFFYDDDASLGDPDTLARMVERMEPGVAVVQPRGADPTGKPAPRRWVPRLRKEDEFLGGDVPVFWEALSMIRREAFEQVDGWAGEFFFGHEGVDIAMRILDRGWRIVYAPEIEVYHPATPASRHDHHFFTTVRNRVWVARRNLPAPLVPLYLAVWLAATVLRAKKPAAIKHALRGFRAGWSGPVPGGRHPISWRTVWRMTKLGRPPLW